MNRFLNATMLSTAFTLSMIGAARGQIAQPGPSPSPLQWNYTIPSGITTATYPGNVVILGTCEFNVATSPTSCGGGGGGSITDFSVVTPGADSDTNFTNEGATQLGALAIGVNASANFPRAISVGNATLAGATASLAFGVGATAGGSDAIAIGNAAMANPSAGGFNDIAMGNGATANGGSTVAVGFDVQTLFPNDIAIGNGANSAAVASGNDPTGGNIAIGSGATDSFVNGGIAFGLDAFAGGGISEAFVPGPIAIGTSTVASGEGTVAIGYITTASGLNAIAMGAGPTASAANSLAIGAASVTSVSQGVALGYQASASSSGTNVALGAMSADAVSATTSSVISNGATYSVAGVPFGVVSVGKTSGGNQRTIINVAAGSVTSTSTDAVNGSELFAAFEAASGAKPQSTVSELPSCTASNQGQEFVVTDATSPTFNAALTGGGTVLVLGVCLGTTWTAH
jgi:trimeric autotransporter adhesin